MVLEFNKFINQKLKYNLKLAKFNSAPIMRLTKKLAL